MPDTQNQNEEIVLLKIETIGSIAVAALSSGGLAVTDVPDFMARVGQSIDSLLGFTAADPVPQAKEPAVPIKKSITPDYLICLEDGKKLKSLKRYLRTHYDLTPEAYRAKWGLPKDYPMVAPNYSKARSEMAKSMGLGQGGRKPKAADSTATRGRGGSRKTQPAAASA